MIKRLIFSMTAFYRRKMLSPFKPYPKCPTCEKEIKFILEYEEELDDLLNSHNVDKKYLIGCSNCYLIDDTNMYSLIEKWNSYCFSVLYRDNRKVFYSLLAVMFVLPMVLTFIPEEHIGLTMTAILLEIIAGSFLWLSIDMINPITKITSWQVNRLRDSYIERLSSGEVKALIRDIWDNKKRIIIKNNLVDSIDEDSEIKVDEGNEGETKITKITKSTNQIVRDITDRLGHSIQDKEIKQSILDILKAIVDILKTEPKEPIKREIDNYVDNIDMIVSNYKEESEEIKEEIKNILKDYKVIFNYSKATVEDLGNEEILIKLKTMKQESKVMREYIEKVKRGE